MSQNDSESNPAVPGGSLAKPLIIALLALLASRAMSGGQKQAPAEAPKLPESIPGSAEAAPGDVLDGLGGLIEQFQKTADPKALQRNPLYAAMIKRMDNAVGKLLDSLEAAKAAYGNLYTAK